MELKRRLKRGLICASCTLGFWLVFKILGAPVIDKITLLAVPVVGFMGMTRIEN